MSAQNNEDTADARQLQDNYPHENAQHTPVESGDESEPGSQKQYIVNSLFTVEGEDSIPPPVFLPVLIGLFLFTSTFVQNITYNMTNLRYIDEQTYMLDTSVYTPKRQLQFSSLVYNMIYLGPVWGLIVDLVRVFRERYRPCIIIAALLTGVLCWIAYGVKGWDHGKYGGFLVICWLMEISTMFIYIPMNAVVISYGNSVFESAQESSARIGCLMAQAQVWRNCGSLLYNIVFVCAKRNGKPVDSRTRMIIAGALNFGLVLQVCLMWRHYFVDRREASLKHSVVVRFYRSILHIHRRAVSKSKETIGYSFVFILCFIFIYFMLPDALYTELYTFNYYHSATLGPDSNRAMSILPSAGAVVGALLYALWMILTYMYERSHGHMAKANPFQVVLAGCIAWSLGHFFHFIGQWGTGNNSFKWHVFLPFQSFIVQVCLMFAFMPTLSLAAMHAPHGYETTAFELFSVCTTGGGTVSYMVSSNLISSLGASVTGGYWKFLLLCIFFRMFPAGLAFCLPKYRQQYDNWSAEETDSEVENEPGTEALDVDRDSIRP